jgi:hypothetical protein
VKAACSCIVAFIEKKDAKNLIEKKPALVFPIAYSILQRCSSFVRAIDFALGWVMLDSGEALYRFLRAFFILINDKILRKNDFFDSVYVILSGRLRSVTDKVMIEEYGKGDVLGIVEVLQQSTRSTTGITYILYPLSIQIFSVGCSLLTTCKNS